MKKYINGFELRKNNKKVYPKWDIWEVVVFNGRKEITRFKLDNVIERGLRTYKLLKVRK